MENQPEEFSVAEIINKYLRLYWHWLWLIILVTLITSGCVYFLSRRQTPMYQASATVMINVSSNSQDIGTAIYVSTSLAESYSNIMESRTVLDAVAQRLGIKDSQDVSVQVKPIPNSTLLTVTAIDTDPNQAALVANTVVKVFNEQLQSDQTARYSDSKLSIQSQMDSLNQQIQTVSASLAVLNQQIQDNNSTLNELLATSTTSMTPAELSQYSSSIQQTKLTLQTEVSQQSKLQIELQNYQHSYSIIMQSYDTIVLAEIQVTSGVLLKDPAIAPAGPFQPQPLRNALLAGGLGLLLCGAIIFLIDYLDDTFKTPEDVKRVLGLPIIGMIGEMENTNNGSGGVYVGENPRSPIAEAYRVLRTNLEFAGVDQPLTSLLVTSVGPQEGKTTISVNLGTIIAQGGKKVVIVDGDLRRPTLHRQLHIENHTGLSDLFLNSTSDALQVVTCGETKLWAITSGPLPPNPTDLFGSEKFTQILNSLRKNCDLVIMDSAPSIVSDPIIISTKVDAVLLVIKPGSTKKGAAQVLMEQFERSGARMVGVVLNPISRSGSKYSSKYQYYSKYYQSSSKSESYYSNEGHKNRKINLTQRKRKEKNGESVSPFVGSIMEEKEI